jgi:cell division inhibitor SepF
MGIMDELKRLAHPYEDDDDELDEEYEDGVEETEEEEEQTVRHSAPRPEKTTPRTGSAAGGSYFESRRDSKVVNITSPNQMQVVLVEPSRVENADNMREIADHLMAKRTVVLNLEKADKETIDHLLFFMGGVAYAVQGNMKRVAQNTYIVMPHNVNMEGELRDELEHKGWMF